MSLRCGSEPSSSSAGSLCKRGLVSPLSEVDSNAQLPMEIDVASDTSSTKLMTASEDTNQSEAKPKGDDSKFEDTILWKPKGFKHWGPRRKALWLNLDKAPGAYYHEFTAPNECWKGSLNWTHEETLKLKALVSNQRDSAQREAIDWGLFSRRFRGRTGRDCHLKFKQLLRYQNPKQWHASATYSMAVPTIAELKSSQRQLDRAFKKTTAAKSKLTKSQIKQKPKVSAKDWDAAAKAKRETTFKATLSKSDKIKKLKVKRFKVPKMSKSMDWSKGKQKPKLAGVKTTDVQMSAAKNVVDVRRFERPLCTPSPPLPLALPSIKSASESYSLASAESTLASIALVASTMPVLCTATVSERIPEWSPYSSASVAPIPNDGSGQKLISLESRKDDGSQRLKARLDKERSGLQQTFEGELKEAKKKKASAKGMAELLQEQTRRADNLFWMHSFLVQFQLKVLNVKVQRITVQKHQPLLSSAAAQSKLQKQVISLIS